MNQGSITLVPIFATPMAMITLPQASHSPEVVAQLLTAHAAANPAQSTAGGLVYQSRDDLLEWPDAPVRQLCSEILRGIWSTVAAATTLSHDQLSKLSVHARAAYTIVQHDGCVPATSHSLTAWCGICCLQAPAAAATRSDSGVVRFYESRLGTSLADATTSALRAPFLSGNYSWRAVPGQLIVFPGSLSYEIPLIRAAGALTLVTVRARFVAPGQEGLTRW